MGQKVLFYRCRGTPELMHGSTQFGGHLRPAQAAAASHRDATAIQELHWQYVTLQAPFCRAPEISGHDDADFNLTLVIGCLGDLSEKAIQIFEVSEDAVASSNFYGANHSKGPLDHSFARLALESCNQFSYRSRAG